MSSKTLDLIRNAKPGSMIDVRSPDNQIDSFPVEKLWDLLGDDEMLRPPYLIHLAPNDPRYTVLKDMGYISDNQP